MFFTKQLSWIMRITYKFSILITGWLFHYFNFRSHSNFKAINWTDGPLSKRWFATIIRNQLSQILTTRGIWTACHVFTNHILQEIVLAPLNGVFQIIHWINFFLSSFSCGLRRPTWMTLSLCAPTTTGMVWFIKLT